MKITDVPKLLTSLLLCQAAGVIGSFFTIRSVDTWYVGIRKPFFNPPDSVFAPVWIVLYALMGISLFLIWRKGSDGGFPARAFSVFILQLILNSFWSFAFFGCRSSLAGFIVIVLLWVAIIWTIVLFLRISRMAAIFLFPYILWVSFALVLNGAIVLMN
jgi:translocator protein